MGTAACVDSAPQHARPQRCLLTLLLPGGWGLEEGAVPQLVTVPQLVMSRLGAKGGCGAGCCQGAAFPGGYNKPVVGAGWGYLKGALGSALCLPPAAAL